MESFATGTISERRLYWLWLCAIPGISPGTISGLLGYFKDVENIFKVTERELDRFPLIKETTKRHLLDPGRRDREKLAEYAGRLKGKGIGFICREDGDFPKRFEHMEVPPFGLFYAGCLPPEGALSVAIVGSRSATSYGIGAARYFSGVLAGHGACVISGLASGVDGAAHKGALKAGGYTAAVLGCGVDICYPRENFTLYMKIKEQGGMISEYPPGTRPAPWHFPMRNRLIAGLADGVLVAEACEKSGALITADAALDQGKNVYALPGAFDSPQSRGCHQLIQSGAKLVYRPEDILEDFHIERKAAQKRKDGLDNSEEVVYANLCLYPRSLQEVADRCGLSLQDVSAALLRLELEGRVVQTGSHYYVIRMS